ncbi:MAG: S8 family serine peptidase [Candidatus Kapaibacterium sp.]
MTHRNVIAVALLMLAAFAAPNLLSVEYIVKINPNKKNSQIQNKTNLKPIFSKLNTSKLNKVNSNSLSTLDELQNYYLLDIDESDLSNLISSDYFESITPNYVYKIESAPIPNDPRFASQWNLQYLGISDAWEKATGKGIIVGVVDTGLDFDHEDIQGQMWVNEKEDLNNNGRLDPWPSTEVRDGVSGDFDFIDNDGNGYADDVIGYDFVNVSSRNLGDDLDPDPNPYDEESHGTSMAGIIAARHNNGLGIAGIAYDSKIMSLRAFDISGAGESDDIAAAVLYAVMNGANVLNFSFGEEYYSPLLHDVIKFAYANDVVMVGSSGNNNWYRKHYPSDFEEVISVGGITERFFKSSISNYGNRIDILAPGQAVPSLSPNNQYSAKSGTSVASPHVTATVALLLEQNSKLKPEEIKFILENSATDDKEFPGWDPFYGKGILNINNALNSKSKGTVTITYPENDAAIFLSNSDSLAIIGTVTHPLLRSYSLFIRKGISPFNQSDFRSEEAFTEWIPASSRLYDQVINDTIAMISKSLFKDSIYTVRLKIDLLNNSTYEHRFYFRPFTQSVFTRNQYVVEPKAVRIYDADIQKVMLTATTLYNSLYYVELYDESGKYIITFSEVVQSSLDHSVVVDNLVAGEKYSYKAFAVSSTDTIIKEGWFPEINENISTSAFRSKPYRIENSYLYNGLYDEANNTFASTKLNGVNFVSTSFFEYNDGKITKTDSIDYPRIIEGFGDSDGDGIKEILTSGNGELVLFEAEGNKKFGKIIYKEDYSIVWPSQFVDIDKDGREDIIAHDDSSYFVIKYENGNYIKKNRIVMPSEYGRFDNSMSSIFANVDDDPEMELVFTNSIGRLFINEYKNGEFVKEFESLQIISNSSQHLCAADIDNDGISEFLVLNAGVQKAFNSNGGKELVWTAQLWDYKDKEFKVIWEELFSGVKLGVVNFSSNSYKNGVSCGDLDGVPGDEIIISTFPDLYVFKYNNGTMRPLWYYAYTLSNSALVHDFDKNGRNEMAVNTFFGTQFFEISDNELTVTAPANFRGRPVNENTVKLEWDRAPNAESYQIYRLLDQSNGQGTLYAETQFNSLQLDTLDNLTWYDFFIISKASDGTTSNNASNLVSCFTHPMSKIVDLKFVTPRAIEIEYDTKMPDYELEPRRFSLTNDDNTYVPNNVISSQDKKLRIFFNESIFAGSYTLVIPEIEDYYRQLINATSYTLQSEYEGEEQELYFTSGERIGNKLIVSFSEEVDNTALDISNYELSPVGKILSIIKNDAPNQLTFETDAFTQNAVGFKYTLTASDKIEAASGKKMTTGAGSVLQFTYFKDELEGAYAYPQPLKLSKNQDITFANLTSNATISIFNNRGEYIQSITEYDGDGGASWNLIDNKGNKLKAGIYYFTIEGGNPDFSNGTNSTELKNSTLKKFMIID